MKLMPSFFVAAGLLMQGGVVHAEESEAPKYLLGDVGVRVDLPSGWNMLRWSDWDFKAETSDRALALFAWSTPIQAKPNKADLHLWRAHYIAKAEEFDGTDVEVVKEELDTEHGVPIATFELAFRYKGKSRMALHGAAVPVRGSVFHIALVSAANKSSRARKNLGELVAALDIRTPVEEEAYGSQVEASGVTWTLGDQWRPPVQREMAVLAPRIADLGLEELETCAIALRPRGPEEPDLIVTCQGGMWLGIVDEYTYDDKELLLRPKIFGSADVPAAQPVELSDRIGFHYHPDIGNRQLHVGVVPYDQGLARTWVMGTTADDLGAVLETGMKTAVYSGPHHVSMTDRLGYVMYNPIYLVGGIIVLGLGLLGIAGLGMVITSRRRNKYEDLD